MRVPTQWLPTFAVASERNSRTCDVKWCPAVGANAASTCTSSGTCSFACKSGYKKSNDKCVKECVPAQCRRIPNSVSWCTTSGECDYTCKLGLPLQKAHTTCLKISDTIGEARCVMPCEVSKCRKVTHAVSWCTTSGDCDYTCNIGYQKKNAECQRIASICDPKQCLTVAHASSIGTSSKCDFACNTGNNKQRGCCVVTRKCPTHPHGVSSCTTAGACVIACNTGYIKQGSTCVATPPTCVVSKCPMQPHGASSCSSSGSCAITCNTGCTKQDSVCVLTLCQMLEVAFIRAMAAPHRSGDHFPGLVALSSARCLKEFGDSGFIHMDLSAEISILRTDCIKALAVVSHDCIRAQCSTSLIADEIDGRRLTGRKLRALQHAHATMFQLSTIAQRFHTLVHAFAPPFPSPDDLDLFAKEWNAATRLKSSDRNIQNRRRLKSRANADNTHTVQVDTAETSQT
ncbi:BQ5605_C017g08508 [Microbotryum silenes-dioicae]|uniref:BQ5605_C017g08508 protein n=1 Tax=Microbotryum silenes-dioicae TaxID=796604 RepID=A0A2X0NSL3_9BASI|nr:BQ5605_C017g08508 [Microbotryum silenes-dioicae]